jgi:L-gulono-1,4-lactone dehydrogenase
VARKQTEEVRPSWRNWSREQRCRPARIVRPQTREGLAFALARARERGEPLKVAGAGHSFSPAPLTDGLLVRIDALDRLLDFDRSSGLVKVEGGIVLGELNRRLDRLGVAFENLGDIDRQTLAGSISTGTHGTGARYPNLSAQVISIELIGADGTTSVLSEKGDPEGFRAARVGIGALGAIYSVTLRTVPSYTLDRTDRRRPLGEVLDRIDELPDAYDHFEFYVFPHTDTALCRETARTDAPPQPPNAARAFAQEVVLENWIAAGFAALARRAPAAVPSLARLAAAGVGTSRRVDKSFRVFASERRIRFTEIEYSVPRADARTAVERVLEIAARPEHRCAFPIEVRFVAADDALLSPSHERDSCYIAVHQDRRLDWAGLFAEVERALADLAGRPHWGKRHNLTAAQLEPLYPRWGDFAAVRRRLDPDGAFANAYLDRVLGGVGA